MAITALEKRFGTVAFKKGFITAEQFLEAMNIQIIENLEQEKHRLIGEILLEQGFITQQQIDDVMETLVGWS